MKKMVSGFAALLMLISMLTACGNGEELSGLDGSQTEEATTQQQSSLTAEQDTTVPKQEASTTTKTDTTAATKQTGATTTTQKKPTVVKTTVTTAKVTTANGKQAQYDAAVSLIDKGKYSDAYDTLCKLSGVPQAQSLLRHFVLKPGKVTTVSDGDSETATFEYDHHGNMTKKSTASGVTVYTYDAFGNCISETNSSYDGYTSFRTYTYDAQGNRIKEVWKSNQSTDEDVTLYAYDAFGNCIEEKEGTVVRNTYAYEYDHAGRYTKKTRTFYDPGPTVVTTTYEYDGAGRCTKEVETSAYAPEMTTWITYNAKGNLSKVVMEIGTQKMEMPIVYGDNGYPKEMTGSGISRQFSEYRVFYSESEQEQSGVTMDWFETWFS